jgi:hypothetical protein
MEINPDLLSLQKNLALRRLFSNRGLDLEAVMEFTPHDLDLENLRLQSLAEFIVEYDRYGSQEAMEVIKGDYVFPPVFPGISPESDWLRFERWLAGKPVSQELRHMLPGRYASFRAPADISDDEIDAEAQRLVSAIEEIRIGVGLQDDLPPRLLYSYLYETLNESFYVEDVGWNIDGCSGYCPGCIQRPWCDTGQSLCWPEDEEAGKMYLIEELAPYVSASPQSLALLQQSQAEHDAAMAKIREKNPSPLWQDKGEADQDWLAQQN